MNKYIISIITLTLFITIIGCGKKDESENKLTIQKLADKEKELNDREAAIRLKEIELEQREKKLNLLEHPSDTTGMSQYPDTSGMNPKENKQEFKKEIQSEITKKFENPATTVKDYYEYIQRAINETGNFDSNMKKAHNYYPSRPSEKLKAAYRNTKVFTVLEEPKVVSQKNDKSVVSSKVKQVDVVKKEGKEQEVTKVLTVTYNLTANKEGQWVITGNSVKVSK
jgi:hypothetical protein